MRPHTKIPTTQAAIQAPRQRLSTVRPSPVAALGMFRNAMSLRVQPVAASSSRLTAAARTAVARTANRRDRRPGPMRLTSRLSTQDAPRGSAAEEHGARLLSRGVGHSVGAVTLTQQPQTLLAGIPQHLAGPGVAHPVIRDA